MIPRKKRTRYKLSAIRIAENLGIDLDPNNWEQIWSLLDTNDETVFFYALGDPDATILKFGKSVNPGFRLKQIKTGNPTVKLIAFCPHESPLTERDVFSRLKKDRVGGEWFRITEETQQVVREMWAACALWEMACYISGQY